MLKKILSKLPVLAFDIAAIPVAWYSAYWLRYNLKPFPQHLIKGQALKALLVLGLVQIACYYYYKTYRGLWRFSSINDLMRIVKASVNAVVMVIPLLYLSSLIHYLPRSILPLYIIIVTLLLASGRLMTRLHWDKKNKVQATADLKKILIIGAGQAGEGLLRDIQRANLYHVLGFVDDNLEKRGLEVHGVRVLGTTRQLSALVQDHPVELIFIAIPTATSATMRRIVRACEKTKVPFRTLPSLAAIAAGHVTVRTLRPVNIEDLLGRDQINLEWHKIAGCIAGKKVVVTGGGGSIGSELCRQIMALHPQQLTVVDHCEFNLYQIEQELLQLYPQVTILPCLMSVTDATGINHVFNQVRPEIVFHAAAYKHVPMLQDQIRVAISNNVLGTQIVAQASVACGVEKFVLISSDKAVNPTNIMGTTKRVAEIYCQNLDGQVQTQFITVRFGNVLGSAGSVVPLFQKQLQSGGPLTVTHPKMQRYFMTIAEASGLILQAMANGNGGEIFVLDMGEPILISYLAEQMIRLAGKEPGTDIEIVYTGLRPGEKLYEELFHASEALVTTAHEKLYKATFRKLPWEELNQTLRMLLDACNTLQEDEMVILLKSLVPEFHPEIHLDIFKISQ